MLLTNESFNYIMFKNDVRSQYMEAENNKSEKEKTEEQKDFCSSGLSIDDLKEIIDEMRLE